jgi:hypothetical protein
MTMREGGSLRTIPTVVNCVLMTWQAAERLQSSRREVKQLVTVYRVSGAPGMRSRRRDRPGNRKLHE